MRLKADTRHAGCGADDRDGHARDPSQRCHAQARTAPVPIRLYVFDGGTLESDPARYELTKEDVKVTQLSVAAYLIVHPKGLLMWDTEAVPDSEWTPTGSPVRQRLTLSDGQERFVTDCGAARRAAAGRGTQASGHHVPGAVALPLGSHREMPACLRVRRGLYGRSNAMRCFPDKVAGTSRPQTYAVLKNSKTVIITLTSTTSSATAP
jgi:hypothetical protein